MVVESQKRSLNWIVAPHSGRTHEANLLSLIPWASKTIRLWHLTPTPFQTGMRQNILCEFCQWKDFNKGLLQLSLFTSCPIFHLLHIYSAIVVLKNAISHWYFFSNILRSLILMKSKGDLHWNILLIHSFFYFMAYIGIPLKLT